MFSQIMKKYKLLKYRQKISYMAFVKKQTIIELWINSLINTFIVSEAEGTLEEICTD